MLRIRLLATKMCDRHCCGCCNNEWDLDNLPVFHPTDYLQDKLKPEIIMITGGEPLLFPDQLVELIKQLKTMFPSTQVTFYTAKLDNVEDLIRALNVSDGMTLTLHEYTDVDLFHKIQNQFPLGSGMHYLNIFRGVQRPVTIHANRWKRVKIVEWIKNCPLPPQEVFLRTKTFWGK